MEDDELLGCARDALDEAFSAAVLLPSTYETPGRLPALVTSDGGPLVSPRALLEVLEPLLDEPAPALR